MRVLSLLFSLILGTSLASKGFLPDAYPASIEAARHIDEFFRATNNNDKAGIIRLVKTDPSDHQNIDTFISTYQQIDYRFMSAKFTEENVMELDLFFISKSTRAQIPVIFSLIKWPASPTGWLIQGARREKSSSGKRKMTGDDVSDIVICWANFFMCMVNMVAGILTAAIG
ncbi:hypothetical protein GCK72_020694 [Caenorhabditis remanei]|uniref:Uncharacterized protein n=1 Tax=Caenorhabditis remanei TaxID=31234 RepID=A0A6A5GH92_CAERE|nr:hypothetical protein GCK72_020694 [Caenorhabditis remanei]KAF1754134.1 hypothetical protein GCK72_020694 [Caenorhabditis remanei]